MRRPALAMLLGVGVVATLGSRAGAEAPPEPLAATRSVMEIGTRWPDELRGTWSQLTSARMTPHGRWRVLTAMGAMAPSPSDPATARPGDARFLVRHLGGATALLAAGLRATPLSTTVASVVAGPDELARLLNLPGVLAIDGERQLKRRIDRSQQLTGARALNQSGIGGRGVLIGLVDTGIDFRHADFRHIDGTTRVDYLLDAGQARGNLHPELPAYDGMAVYTAADINAVLDAEAKGMTPPVSISQRDFVGHGSHVAGIAASSGFATGMGKPAGRYVGMAPQASLCVAKGTRDETNFTDADLLTGVRFCFDRGADTKRPVVVNLSLGSAGGTHDGTSPLEVALDELCGDRPGRVVVVANGNSGEVDGHASSALLDGMHEIPIHLEPSDPDNKTGPSAQSSVRLEFYYDASAPHTDGAADVQLELKGPGGKVLKVPSGQSLEGKFDDDGDAIIDNSDQAMTGLRGVAIQLQHAEGQKAIKAGDWILRVRGRTLRYDLWLVDPSEDPTVGLRGHLSPDTFVEIPATGHNVIAVGAARTRMDWLRADGQLVAIERELGRASPFSASGPTRDGRFVPDVLAPGEFVASVLSASAPPTDPHSAFFVPDDPGFLVADDGLHGVLRGTSQATPHVAGAVALLLQLDPSLTPTQLRELLRTTTAADRAGGYGPRHGFGSLSLQTALTRLRGDPAVLVSAFESDVGVNRDVATPHFDEVTVTVTPRDLRSVPLGPGVDVDIAADAGEWAGPVVDTQHGRYERTLRTNAARGTRITITAHAAGIALSRQPVVYLVGERSEIGTPYVIGACSAAPAGARGSSGAVVLLLAVTALCLVGRRRRSARVALVLVCGLAGGGAGCSEPEPDTADPGRASSSTATGPARRAKQHPGGDYFWRAGETLSRPAIVIHLGDQRADIFDGNELVAQSSVCTGRRSHKTPPGQYAILEKIPEHVSSRYGDYIDDRGQVVATNVDMLGTPMPAGTTFRGTPMPYFLRILGGVGMHAGPLPGFPDSHGCIRFPEFIAQRLFYAADLGAPVSIVE